jgi:membrane protease YdiL (CAAX protease family)
LPALWLLAAGCLAVLLRDPGFDRRRLWNRDRLGARVRVAAVPFLLSAPILALSAWWFEPDRFLLFARQRPLLWGAVMVLYPVLSVYPQGIVFRVFLLHRYRPLFPGRWGIVVASAAAFALVHLVFRNWVAPPLSFAGGILFAATYERTGSSLVAAIQHALFGCLLFTIGLGWYFYHGAAIAG